MAILKDILNTATSPYKLPTFQTSKSTTIASGPAALNPQPSSSTAPISSTTTTPPKTSTGLTPVQQAQYDKTFAAFSQPPIQTDTTSPVSPEDISKTKTINSTTPPPINTEGSKLTIIGGKTSEQADMDIKEAAKPKEDAVSKYLGLTEQAGGRAQETLDLQEKQDIEGKTKAVNKVNSEILTTTRAYEKQIREVQKNASGSLAGGVQIETQRIAKERDEQLADLAIQKAVALGDLETANAIVDTAIKAKYEPIAEQLKSYETLVGIYQNDMTESEKFEAQTNINSTIEELNYRQGLQTAAVNDANASGQSGVASKILRLDPSSPTFKDDLANLQGQIIKTSDGAFAGLTTSQASMLNSIAGQYRKSPLVAASNRTPVLTDSIKQVRANPKNGALQLNLAYSYIQALDTYQSAVREGELSLVNSIDSKVGQISNYAQQITNGQIVRPEVIKQMADAAESIVTVINDGAKRSEQDFASQASAVGLGEVWNRYTGGFEKTYDLNSGSAGQDVPSQIEYNGKIYNVDENGDMTEA